MVNENKVTAVNGNEIYIEADTVCIHGDTENAVAIAKAVCNVLRKLGHLKAGIDPFN